MTFFEYIQYLFQLACSAWVFLLAAAAFFAGAIVLRIKKPLWGKIALALITALFLTPALIFMSLPLIMSSSRYIDRYAVLAAAVILLAAASLAVCGLIRKKAVWISLVSAATALAVTVGCFHGYYAYIDSIEMTEGYDVTAEFSPNGDRVARLAEPCTLELSGDMPRLSAATALYPIASAAATAAYPAELLTSDRYVCAAGTDGAYRDILTGEADIILVGTPSESQLEDAERAGIELEFTPIGKEAFVFFVNSKNPLDNVTLDEVRGIYGGKITEWSQLGVNGLGKIRAFQRNEGSGSQNRFEKLMEGVEIMKPPTEQVVGAMEGIVTRVSDYQNHKNAIGYTFRFYAAEMLKNDKVKLLSLDGVYPSTETIEDGSYPVSNEFYAVTRKGDVNPNVRLMTQWLAGVQGQYLIEKTGYTPIKK